MDIAHIISSQIRFDLIEMYLLQKRRLKCICILIGQTFATIFRRPGYKRVVMRMSR